MQPFSTPGTTFPTETNQPYSFPGPRELGESFLVDFPALTTAQPQIFPEISDIFSWVFLVDLWYKLACPGVGKRFTCLSSAENVQVAHQIIPEASWNTEPDKTVAKRPETRTRKFV